MKKKNTTKLNREKESKRTPIEKEQIEKTHEILDLSSDEKSPRETADVVRSRAHKLEDEIFSKIQSLASTSSNFHLEEENHNKNEKVQDCNRENNERYQKKGRKFDTSGEKDCRTEKNANYSEGRERDREYRITSTTSQARIDGHSKSGERRKEFNDDDKTREVNEKLSKSQDHKKCGSESRYRRHLSSENRKKSEEVDEKVRAPMKELKCDKINSHKKEREEKDERQIYKIDNYEAQKEQNKGMRHSIFEHSNRDKQIRNTPARLHDREDKMNHKYASVEGSRTYHSRKQKEKIRDYNETKQRKGNKHKEIEKDEIIIDKMGREGRKRQGESNKSYKNDEESKKTKNK